MASQAQALTQVAECDCVFSTGWRVDVYFPIHIENQM